MGADRLAPIIDAATARLGRLTGAGQPDSAIPTFAVAMANVPPDDRVDRCSATDVIDGALLATHSIAADGSVVITVFTRPLLLWGSSAGASLPHLVRVALAEQLAMAVGQAAGDLDPEAG